MLFFQGSESLLNLKARVSFNLDLILRVPNPLLGDVNLLGNLHISSMKSHKEYIHVRINMHLNIQRNGLLTNLPMRGPSSMT